MNSDMVEIKHFYTSNKSIFQVKKFCFVYCCFYFLFVVDGFFFWFFLINLLIYIYVNVRLLKCECLSKNACVFFCLFFFVSACVHVHMNASIVVCFFFITTFKVTRDALLWQNRVRRDSWFPRGWKKVLNWKWRS